MTWTLIAALYAFALAFLWREYAIAPTHASDCACADCERSDR